MAEAAEVTLTEDQLHELAALDMTPAEILGAVKAMGSADAAAAHLGVSLTLVEAAVQMAGTAQGTPATSKPLDTVKDVLGLLTAIGVLVLLLGGALVAMRLQFANLPAQAVFAQLPREFLIAVGTSQVLAPALIIVVGHALLRGLFFHGYGVSRRLLMVGAASWLGVLIVGLLIAAGKVTGAAASKPLAPEFWPIAVVVLVLAVAGAAAVRAKWSEPAGGFRWRHGPDWITLSIAYGVVAMIGATLIAATFPLLDAKACMTSGFSEDGDLVAQGADRIYLGENLSQPRRIASLPTSAVEELFIGTNARGALCDARGLNAPVLVHAAIDRARRKVASAKAQVRTLGSSAGSKRLDAVSTRIATNAQQALRSTLIGADAGANVGDDLRREHPDEADEITASVIDTRFRARDAQAAIDAMQKTLTRSRRTRSWDPLFLRAQADLVIERAGLAAAAATRVDRATYKASTLLIPQPR